MIKCCFVFFAVCVYYQLYKLFIFCVFQDYSNDDTKLEYNVDAENGIVMEGYLFKRASNAFKTWNRLVYKSPFFLNRLENIFFRWHVWNKLVIMTIHYICIYYIWHYIFHLYRKNRNVRMCEYFLNWVFCRFFYRVIE